MWKEYFANIKCGGQVELIKGVKCEQQLEEG